MATATATTNWGATLAKTLLLGDEHPHLVWALTQGIDTDLSTLASVLSTAVGSQAALPGQWATLMATLESALAHLSNSSNEAAAVNGELTDKLEEVRTETDNLRVQLAEAKDTIHTLTKSLIHNGTLNGIGGSDRRLTKDPDKFGGMEKDTAKRQREYVNWRSQITRVFAVDSNIFNTEFRQIQHISGLLEDDAYELLRDGFNEVINHPLHPEAWPWKTAKGVFHILNNQYETIDLARDASLKFDNLKMGGKPFQNFIAEFNLLSTKCSKTPEQKVEALRLKVSDELAKSLAHRTGKPSKHDFDAWSKFYQEIYDDLRDEEHFAKLRASKGVAYQPHAQQQPAQQQAPQPQAVP
jgi:ElaB/YqjD/DUF883 family membrane-anchored ribosome-binding protein